VAGEQEVGGGQVVGNSVGSGWGLPSCIRGQNNSDVEERDLCYRVKRRSTSRSGTSQNPQTPTPNQHQSQKYKSHILIV